MQYILVKKTYEQYENEVDAWSSISTLVKAKQGMLLMLSLPDSGKHGDLRCKVIDGCDYKGEIGLENVKAFPKGPFIYDVSHFGGRGESTQF